MLGSLRCALGHHDWLAEKVNPTARLARMRARCSRCGALKRTRDGRVVLYRTPWVRPEPPRRVRRQQEREAQRTDAMIRRADREQAELEKLYGSG